MVVATGSDDTVPGTGEQVVYERVGDDLPLLMARLRSDHGVRSVLCEGGPTLNSFLFAAGLVDELFLTLHPTVLAGAAALTIVAGRELVEPADLELISLAEGGGDLFTRWRVKRTQMSAHDGCTGGSTQGFSLRITLGWIPFTPKRRTPGRAGSPRGADVPVVEFKDVSKVYDGGSVGLDGASMRIGRGEFVFLVGPTGCGKSTCIRLLLMELEASRGEISIAGRELSGIPRSRVPYLRRNLGVVFQDYKLLPNRTIYDNVAYSLQVIGESRQEIRRKVPDILRLVGLSTKLHNFPDELSGGEQQRVSIARAFVNHPPLVLADEPTGNLDPETSIGIMQLIYRINRTGTTVIVATHDKEMVDKMRRRVIELREGRIIRDELSGLYRPDESTTEFAVRLRGELGVGDEGHPN